MWDGMGEEPRIVRIGDGELGNCIWIERGTHRVLQARLPRRRLEALVRQSVFVLIVVSILVVRYRRLDRLPDHCRGRSRQRSGQ
jgi:hypothetical protein